MLAGSQALSDVELLELVVNRANSEVDAKPAAVTLIDAFGDFNHAISSPTARLKNLPGIGEDIIRELKIIEAAAHRLAKGKVIGRHAISGWDSLLEYCRSTMAFRDTEHFRILFLDRKNYLIADEEQQSGTVDHVPVYPREVVKRALELNASALILVHNHPSGIPDPSDEDIAMTKRIVNAAEALGITIHDHVIIGKERTASLRTLGHV
jgi:DNA repair protein RadC